MPKKYYIAEIINKGEFDFKITYSLPLKIEEKLTRTHPCIICKMEDCGFEKTVFCILASSATDAENKLVKYITIPPRRLR